MGEGHAVGQRLARYSIDGVFPQALKNIPGSSYLLQGNPSVFWLNVVPYFKVGNNIYWVGY